jgi:rod shape determining protein RodA
VRNGATRQAGDVTMLVTALALAAFGVAMVYSAGELDVPSSVTGIWRRQVIWLALSLIVFYGMLRVPVRWLEWVAPIAYVASLLSLILVLVIGSGSGPKSWIRFAGIGFQPSEFAKIATILMLGRAVGGRRAPPEGLRDLVPLAAIVLLPTALVLLQPDAGTAAVFVAMLLAALYWSGLPITRLILVVSPLISLALVFFANLAMGVLVLPVWRHLAPYQQDRILSFLRPEADPQGAGWHVIQSQVAIGSGGWLGKGFTMGTQKRLAFLPEQHTDFIIAVVGEELGFLGICFVLVAFGVLLWRVLRTAEQTEDAFASMVVFGVFAIWFAHLVANVGMTVGLLPITGLPLTFLSYGGSFLLISFLALGMVQRTAAEMRGGA